MNLNIEEQNTLMKILLGSEKDEYGDYYSFYYSSEIEESIQNLGWFLTAIKLTNYKITKDNLAILLLENFCGIMCNDDLKNLDINALKKFANKLLNKI